MATLASGAETLLRNDCKAAVVFMVCNVSEKAFDGEKTLDCVAVLEETTAANESVIEILASVNIKGSGVV